MSYMSVSIDENRWNPFSSKVIKPGNVYHQVRFVRLKVGGVSYFNMYSRYSGQTVLIHKGKEFYVGRTAGYSLEIGCSKKSVGYVNIRMIMEEWVTNYEYRFVETGTSYKTGIATRYRALDPAFVSKEFNYRKVAGTATVLALKATKNVLLASTKPTFLIEYLEDTKVVTAIAKKLHVSISTIKLFNRVIPLVGAVLDIGLSIFQIFYPQKSIQDHITELRNELTTEISRVEKRLTATGIKRSSISSMNQFVEYTGWMSGFFKSESKQKVEKLEREYRDDNIERVRDLAKKVLAKAESAKTAMKSLVQISTTRVSKQEIFEFIASAFQHVKDWQYQYVLLMAYTHSFGMENDGKAQYDSETAKKVCNKIIEDSTMKSTIRTYLALLLNWQNALVAAAKNDFQCSHYKEKSSLSEFVIVGYSHTRSDIWRLTDNLNGLVLLVYESEEITEQTLLGFKTYGGLSWEKYLKNALGKCNQALNSLRYEVEYSLRSGYFSAPYNLDDLKLAHGENEAAWGVPAEGKDEHLLAVHGRCEEIVGSSRRKGLPARTAVVQEWTNTQRDVHTIFIQAAKKDMELYGVFIKSASNEHLQMLPDGLSAYRSNAYFQLPSGSIDLRVEDNSALVSVTRDGVLELCEIDVYGGHGRRISAAGWTKPQLSSGINAARATDTTNNRCARTGSNDPDPMWQTVFNVASFAVTKIVIHNPDGNDRIQGARVWLNRELFGIVPNKVQTEYTLERSPTSKSDAAQARGDPDSYNKAFPKPAAKLPGVGWWSARVSKEVFEKADHVFIHGKNIAGAVLYWDNVPQGKIVKPTITTVDEYTWPAIKLAK